jgi:hypothetical protein
VRSAHAPVQQEHHGKLKSGNKEWPGEFPGIMLKQTDSRIQQLDDARERTQDQ